MEQQGLVDAVISYRTDSPYAVLPGGATALAVSGLSSGGATGAVAVHSLALILRP